MPAKPSRATKPALKVTKNDLTKGVPAALLDAMAEDAPEASKDQLAKIRGLAKEMRDLDIDNARMKEQTTENNKRIEAIKWQDLLNAMDEAGMRAMTLEAEGNLPAYEVKTGAYYHANIAVDWPPEQKAAAFNWLDKHEPGMLRNSFVIEFGKNSRAVQKKLIAALKKLKIPYSNEFGVPWNTLTAYVKEQIEEHERTPPLELLGAKVGRIATIKKVKEK